MKDINGNPGNFRPTTTSSSPQEKSSEAKSKTASAKGDYIDFEEIK